jgi:septal ring factor EnvC (AmiA/AmiB activator)
MLKRLNPSFMNKKTVSIFSENRLSRELELNKFSEKIRLQAEKLHEVSVLLSKEQSDLRQLILQYNRKKEELDNSEKDQAAMQSELAAAVSRIVSAEDERSLFIYISTIKESVDKELGVRTTPQQIRKACDKLGYMVGVIGTKRKNAVIF